MSDTGDEDQLYLGDFHIGEVYAGQVRRLDEQAFTLFAQITGDSHPIHYDAEYAAKSRFGARVAHGLLVTSMSALGATPLSPRLEASMVALLEQGFGFTKPLLVGDEARTRFTVEAIVRKPGAASGTIRFAVNIANQRGETVASGHHVYLLRCRPAA